MADDGEGGGPGVAPFSLAEEAGNTTRDEQGQVAAQDVAVDVGPIEVAAAAVRAAWPPLRAHLEKFGKTA